MITAIYYDSMVALRSLIKKDEEHIILRHVLEPGEKVDIHYHRRADEWMIIEKGIFDVEFENELHRFNLTEHATVFHFPAEKTHSITARSIIEYYILRDKEDRTIYLNNNKKKEEKE